MVASSNLIFARDSLVKIESRFISQIWAISHYFLKNHMNDHFVKNLKRELKTIATVISTEANFDSRNGEKIQISVSLDILDQITNDENIPTPI